MKRPLAVVVLLALAVPAVACVNTFRGNFMHYKRNGDTAGLAQLVATAEAAYRKSPTLENTNDVAVGWILLGRQQEGLQLLRDLENRSPGNAAVAANLGTALELAGADEEALQWIREGVRRNPNEHQASEWVHVKILEAKLALVSDPDWLRKNSVLGWEKGKPLPKDGKGLARTPASIDQAIRYQLLEREVFVDPPDPVIGDLYATLGDLGLETRHRRDAEAIDAAVSSDYHWALEYGTVHAERIQPIQLQIEQRVKAAIARKQEENRLAAVKQLDEIAEQRRRRSWAMWIFGSMLLAGVVYMTWRWTRKPPQAEA